MYKNAKSIGETRKKVTKTFELISCGYHEAGHTIYALLSFMLVSSVSIFENKKLKRILGVTCYEFEYLKDPDILNTFIKAEIGVQYAGLIAEKSLFKSISGSSQIPMFIKECATEDNQNASSIIKEYNLAPPGKKRALYKQKIIREVQHQLHENWDAVDLVAHALFRQRKLSFIDLQELLSQKSHNKKFWKEHFKNISYFYNNYPNIDENDWKSILLNK